MTNSVNPTANKYEDAFQDLVWDPLVTAAITAVGLNWWPLNFAIIAFSNAIYSRLVMVLDLEIIVLKNDSSKAAFTTAAVTLKTIAADYTIDSPQFQEALSAQKAALSKFISYS